MVVGWALWVSPPSSLNMGVIPTTQTLERRAKKLCEKCLIVIYTAFSQNVKIKNNNSKPHQLCVLQNYTGPLESLSLSPQPMQKKPLYFCIARLTIFSEQTPWTAPSSPTLVKSSDSKTYPFLYSSFTVFSRVSITLQVSPLFESSSYTHVLLLKVYLSTRSRQPKQKSKEDFCF